MRRTPGGARRDPRAAARPPAPGAARQRPSFRRASRDRGRSAREILQNPLITGADDGAHITPIAYSVEPEAAERAVARFEEDHGVSRGTEAHEAAGPIEVHQVERLGPGRGHEVGQEA